MTQFAVSQSKVNDWRFCKRKFHNRWVLFLKPKVKARSLKFGTMSHRMLETAAIGGDPFKTLDDMARREEKLFREEEEFYGRIVDDLGYIFRAYKSYWRKEPLKFVKIGKRKAEHPFEVELIKDIVVKGKIDGVVDFKRKIAMLENKNQKDFGNDDHRWRNLQSAVYLRIIELMDWLKVSGTLWNYIRNKQPTRPHLNKDGTLSKADIDSLPEVVEDTIKEFKLSRALYAGYIEKQRQNLGSWFQRIYVPIDKTVVNALFLEFIETAREMADYYGRSHLRPPARTIGVHCSWCPFEKLCRAELQNSDVDFVMEHEYTVDETEYQTAGEEDE